jgi:integrase
MVCLFCGLRISEALALTEGSLDFTRKLIEIRQSYYRGVLGKAPKTRKGARVPMGYLADEMALLCKSGAASLRV